MPLRGEHPSRKTYRIVGRLPGGKAEIVVANHEILGRLCVQKVVDLRPLSGNLAFQEPRLLDQIEHPRIVPIAEVQYDPERPDAMTFIMPFYEGGSIEGALASGHTFSIGDSLRIGMDLLEALAHLHEVVKVIHRDVKPGNLLLNASRRRGFVADLGSAARLEADGKVPAQLTTLPYLPPETLSGGRVGPQADIYGAGFVLYEMLRGPFDWSRFDSAIMQDRLMRGKRAFTDAELNDFPPHVPERLRRIVRKAMQSSLTQRYGSASHMLSALRGVRAVSWASNGSNGGEEEWLGTWPPHLPDVERHIYRVRTRILRAGANRGLLRAEAHYRRAGSLAWRAAGVPPATLAVGDRRGLTQFFADVAARAAQRTPAR